MTAATKQQVFFLTCLNRLSQIFPKAEAATWSLRAASSPVMGASKNTLIPHSIEKTELLFRLPNSERKDLQPKSICA